LSEKNYKRKILKNEFKYKQEGIYQIQKPKEISKSENHLLI